MRGLPHYHRNSGAGQDRARPHAFREPPDHRRRHAADEQRQPLRLGRRPAGAQARQRTCRPSASSRTSFTRSSLISRRSNDGRDPPLDALKGWRRSARHEAERREVEEEDRRLAEERKKLVRDGPKLTGAELAARLDATWRRPPGILGWLSTVDHKEIGRRYIVTALVFLALGGVLSLAMRVQLARPDQDLIGAARFNELFTMHGSTMMFLFAVPVMEGVAVFIIPLMLGTRSTAFPRLNAFSYFMYLFGGMLLWGAFLLNIGPDIGWFAYTPLSGPQFSPGKRADIWAQMITFTEVAALAAAVVLVATILKTRAPGMTLARMPIFAWAMLVRRVMIIFSMPSVALASSMLHLRPAGRNPILQPLRTWRRAAVAASLLVLRPPRSLHHLPARDRLRQRDRRDLLPPPGRSLIRSSSCALVSTGILAFGLWVHHMFATGLPRVGYSFYTAASMSVSIPTGLQIFCWLATIWDGRPRFAGADAVRDRLHLHLRDRRPDRRDHRLGPARPAASRHLLHRRAFPLRADRRRRFPAAWDPYLLVSRRSPAG